MGKASSAMDVDGPVLDADGVFGAALVSLNDMASLAHSYALLHI
jgi:hypothetical protein